MIPRGGGVLLRGQLPGKLAFRRGKRVRLKLNFESAAKRFLQLRHGHPRGDGALMQHPPFPAPLRSSGKFLSGRNNIALYGILETFVLAARRRDFLTGDLGIERERTGHSLV